MGCAGDDVVRTPHMDRLAQAGVRFDSCYCPAPLCVPSRMSFMSGLYPSRSRVWSNSCILGSGIPTFAHGLGTAGYETVLAGRMHFVGPDQRHGFEHRLVGELTAVYPGAPLKALPRELWVATGQSRAAVTTAGPGRTGYQAYDEAVAEACEHFLQSHRAPERPFCLVAGFVLPHCPFVCRKEDWDYYINRVTLPHIPEGHFDRLHPAVQLWRSNRGVEDLCEDEILRARAGYYGLVTHLDRQIGRITEALNASGLADNTIVIYTSDHGEMAGEHGMWWKSSFYEGSAGIPLIVSRPGQEGVAAPSGRVVNLVDVGPTVLDMAGADSPEGIDGRSFAALLDGRGNDWLDETFSEHGPSMGVPACRMIRRGPWKLTHYEGYRPQLFNLEDDPGEWHDLGEDPAHQEIREQLHTRVLDGWSGRRVTKALERRAREWDLQASWFARVQPDCREQWAAPPGANVFPEE